MVKNSSNQKSPAGELRAEVADRHRTAARTLVPTAPAVILLAVALLLVGLALSFWVFRLQSQQSQLADQMAEQLGEMVERLDLSGVDGRASFEEIGLSLKNLNDRLAEIWQLAGEKHQARLDSHGQAIAAQGEELVQLRKSLEQVAAELSVLSGLISDQKDEIRGGLDTRLKNTARSTAHLEEEQREAKTRLDVAEKQIARLTESATSIESYRRTTNQAIIRLQSRLTLLESRLAERSGSGQQGGRFSGDLAPIQE